MSVELLLLFVILCILFYVWVRWRLETLSLFKNMGIPGPPPHFLFGNIIELNRKGPFQCQKDWIRKYGKIIGFYHGMKPILLVADPDLLRKIFIKDFHLFSDRPESVPLRVHSILDYIIPASKIMDSILTNLKDERWKNVRTVLSPTFSANKLKTMIPAVNKVCDISISILEKACSAGKIVDIYDHMQRLTLDIICAQAFAMDIDSQNHPNHRFLQSAKTILDLPYSSKIIFFGKCFPEFSILAMTVNFVRMFILNKGLIPPLEITKVLEKIIKQRRKDPTKRKPDLLQLLIDASSTYAEENAEESSSSLCTSKLKRKLTLSDVEIQSNALVVFLAGYEAISSGLTFAFHFLATYPDMQKKIQEEIDKHVKTEEELDYYNINNLQIMERFLLEVMRFYPPAAFAVKRISKVEKDYGYIRIPKGVQIEVPVHYIHHSKEFWDQPEVFNPDRFLSENMTSNHIVNYWTFGVGPRSCIGTRLVHLTTKVILQKILHKFTILPASDSSQVKYKFKLDTLVPVTVQVKLSPRFSKKTS